MKNKSIFFSIVFVLVVILSVSGGTYAYYTASVSSGNGTIGGSTIGFSMNISVSTVHSGNLIPATDSLISTSINSNNQCEDGRVYGYSMCNMYHITLTNEGDAVDLIGGIVTDTSSYILNNLKYQLFNYSNNTYTAISDAIALSHTSNAMNYFTLNSSNVLFQFASGSSSAVSRDYYLVIWLSDPGINQLDDRDKSYRYSLKFESSGGGTIVSSFITT